MRTPKGDKIVFHCRKEKKRFFSKLFHKKTKRKEREETRLQSVRDESKPRDGG